jgi:hypothetical protein
MSIGSQPRAKSLRGESEEKKKRAFQASMTDSIKRCIVANCKFA